MWFTGGHIIVQVLCVKDASTKLQNPPSGLLVTGIHGKWALLCYHFQKHNRKLVVRFHTFLTHVQKLRFSRSSLNLWTKAGNKNLWSPSKEFHKILVWIDWRKPEHQSIDLNLSIRSLKQMWAVEEKLPWNIVCTWWALLSMLSCLLFLVSNLMVSGGFSFANPILLMMVISQGFGFANPVM